MECSQDRTRPANLLLGMLSRVSRHLRNPQTLRAIYCAHVRPLLENSCTTRASAIREKVYKFITIVGMDFNYDEVPVFELERALNMNSLEKRIDVQDAMFLFKLVTSAIYSPFLLERVSFRCHGRTRPIEFFARRHHNSFLEANCTMGRVQRLGNRISNHQDFFSCSPSQFKASVERFLLHGCE
ncbi:hypothetical protein J6590_008546 [Homalodisca vitripennis]|nr:hypothetical protein J6590_008546 [Homalodisca vitripennis]